ncbi:MAG: type II toxin-antitoxin system PemK/MazF family toxin [Cyclobacteriaceae bacterium]|nr:type II toxin-antitoxin system PemK/MazF family toxin [Cyclobacteriaceae bacterium]
MNFGEVWDVNFSPKVGDEITKRRPAIIVNHDSMAALKLKVVVPITDGFRFIRDWHVVLHKTDLNGLDKDSVADCFQIKSISKERFIKKRGELSQDEMDDVKLCLMKVLDLI